VASWESVLGSSAIAVSAFMVTRNINGDIEMSYKYWKDSSGQWRWHLLAGNNRIVASSGESYWNEADCLSAIELVKKSNNAPVEKK